MLAFNHRILLGLGAAGCIAVLGFAFYLQYVQEMEPCPLCWFQRLVVFGLAVGFGLAAWLATSRRKTYAFAFMVSLIAVVGMAIAGRHIWIQNLPADQVPACGQGVLYMLDTLPFVDVLIKALKGSGECAKRDLWMGLTLPTWTMLLFCGAALLAWLAAMKAPRPSMWR